MPIRLLLCDDHTMFRQGLRSLLEKSRDVEIIGEASSGREAVEMARKLGPAVAIMDIAMPDLNGIEATRQIREQENPPRIIALSMQSDGPVVKRMFQAGASAYLLKDCSFDELILAIKTVTHGRTYVSSAISDVMVRQLASPQDSAGSPQVLTAKELEVLQLLAEGQSTKEIASTLCVSAKTIDTHRQHIMDKLDMHNIAELTRYAIRQGITFLDARPQGKD